MRQRTPRPIPGLWAGVARKSDKHRQPDYLGSHQANRSAFHRQVVPKCYAGENRHDKGGRRPASWRARPAERSGVVRSVWVLAGCSWQASDRKHNERSDDGTTCSAIVVWNAPRPSTPVDGPGLRTSKIRFQFRPTPPGRGYRPALFFFLTIGRMPEVC